MEGSVPQGVVRYRDPTGPFIMTRVSKSGPIIMTLTAQEWGNIVTPDNPIRNIEQDVLGRAHA
jgi:hypothetical protein